MAQMGQFIPAHLSPLDSGTSWTHCSEAGSQRMETQVPSALSQSPKALDPRDAAYTQACRGVKYTLGVGPAFPHFLVFSVLGAARGGDVTGQWGYQSQGESGPPPPNAGLSVCLVEGGCW